MSSPEEPLLPVAPKPPSRIKVHVLIGLAAASLLTVVLVLAARSRSAPVDDVAAAPDRPAPRTPATDVLRPKSGARPAENADERLAKELYDDAEQFERREPGDYEKRMARWREVVTRYPTSEWARKADEKHRAAAAALQAALDREFESARKDAQALAAAGHFVDAIESLRSYKASQSREPLRKRADVEITALENASRLAYNEGAAKARDLAGKGDYAAAIALVESIGAAGIPEAAAAARTAAAQLRTAAAAHAEHLRSRQGEAARRAVREELAPKLLELVRTRQYDEALKELSSAAANPANTGIKEDLVSERASIADASSFWEAFLKTARAKSGQEASILLADGRRLAGRIAKVQTDRIVMEQGDASTEAPLDRLHADLLVAWTIGRSLPAEDSVTYLKAAMFFFCEGRDDLAKLYLATARELNGSVDAAEKTFREGLVRSAMPVRK